jgi:hypothetical protein
MMKLRPKLIFRILAIGFVVILTFVAPALTGPSKAEDSIVPPILNTTINSPDSGSAVEVGSYFVVQATVTNLQVLTYENGSNTALANFVNAPQDITLTISISGRASTKDPLTKPANPSVLNPGQSGTTSWRLRCNGPGDVTITVTPAGTIGGGNGDPVITVNSALALVDSVPIPPGNLNSATIRVHQWEDAPYSSYAPSEPEYRKPTDARMATTAVYAQPQQAVIGQPVIILGNIANRGESAGIYKATLKINDEIEEIKEGTLPGNMARSLEFTVYRDQPGMYKADINGQQTYFTIIDHQQQSSNTVGPRVIFIIVISALVVLSLIVFLVRRLN